MSRRIQPVDVEREVPLSDAAWPASHAIMPVCSLFPVGTLLSAGDLDVLLPVRMKAFLLSVVILSITGRKVVSGRLHSSLFSCTLVISFSCLSRSKHYPLLH